MVVVVVVAIASVVVAEVVEVDGAVDELEAVAVVTFSAVCAVAVEVVLCLSAGAV